MGIGLELFHEKHGRDESEQPEQRIAKDFLERGGMAIRSADMTGLIMESTQSTTGAWRPLERHRGGWIDAVFQSFSGLGIGIHKFPENQIDKASVIEKMETL